MVIGYFIFDVIAPKRIEIESQKLQKNVDPGATEDKKGSLEEFIKNYNEIENLLIKYGKEYQLFRTKEFQSKYRIRISNIKLAEFMARSEVIDEELFTELKNLITLRNSIIHGAEPIVSPGMVEASSRILKELILKKPT
jgi:hypothetical protein